MTPAWSRPHGRDPARAATARSRRARRHRRRPSPGPPAARADGALEGLEGGCCRAAASSSARARQRRDPGARRAIGSAAAASSAARLDASPALAQLAIDAALIFGRVCSEWFGFVGVRREAAKKRRVDSVASAYGCRRSQCACFCCWVIPYTKFVLSMQSIRSMLRSHSRITNALFRLGFDFDTKLIHFSRLVSRRLSTGMVCVGVWVKPRPTKKKFEVGLLQQPIRDSKVVPRLADQGVETDVLRAATHRPAAFALASKRIVCSACNFRNLCGWC